MMLSVEVSGMKDVERQLHGIGKEANRVLREGARASGRVLQEEIQRVTPVAARSRTVRGQVVTPGLLESAIGMTVKKQKGTHTYLTNVGINVGRQRIPRGSQPIRGKSQAYYGNFLALNTPDRWTGERTRRKTVGGKRVSTKEKTGNPRLFRGRVVGFQWVSRAVSGAAQAAAEAGREKMDQLLSRLSKK